MDKLHGQKSVGFMGPFCEATTYHITLFACIDLFASFEAKSPRVITMSLEERDLASIDYSFPNFADRTKKEMRRICAEEIKTVKQKNESDQEIAKLQIEAENLKLESKKANSKNKHDREIRML